MLKPWKRSKYDVIRKLEKAYAFYLWCEEEQTINFIAVRQRKTIDVSTKKAESTNSIDNLH